MTSVDLASISFAHALILAGGVLQILGFSLVASDLARIRKRFFGPLHLPRFKLPEFGHGAEAPSEFETEFEDRTDLRDMITDLQGALRKLNRAVEENRRDAEHSLDEAMRTLRLQEDQKKSEDKKFTGTSLWLQGLGTICFIVGTAVSVWAGLIA